MSNPLDMSIIVPTNRPLSQVEGSLLNMRNIAAALNVDIIISDNRGDPDKTAALEKAFGDSYFVSPEPESVGNHTFALIKSKTRFSWLLHDDDWIADLGGSMPKSIPHNFVAVCPIIVLSDPAQGVYGVRNFDLCQDDPAIRINAYGTQANGANSLLFAAWETELLRNISLVTKAHPCAAGYQDWAIVQAMLAEGKVLSVDKFGYRYNNQNWYGPPAAIQEEIESLMQRAQLPVILAKHMTELRILDLVCLFGRKQGYNLSHQERFEILHSLLSSIISDYRPTSLSNYLEQILTFLRRIDAQTGDRYLSYVEQTFSSTALEG